jgi:hypothetical protein
MARRSLEILSNPNLHRSMAENARRVAVEKFDTRAVVKQYYDFYEEVLAGKWEIREDSPQGELPRKFKTDTLK